MKFVEVHPRNRPGTSHVINLDTVTRVEPHPATPKPGEEQIAHFFFVDRSNILTTMPFEYASAHLLDDASPEC